MANKHPLLPKKLLCYVVERSSTSLFLWVVISFTNEPSCCVAPFTHSARLGRASLQMMPWTRGACSVTLIPQTKLGLTSECEHRTREIHNFSPLVPTCSVCLSSGASAKFLDVLRCRRWAGLFNVVCRKRKENSNKRKRAQLLCLTRSKK